MADSLSAVSFHPGHPFAMLVAMVAAFVFFAAGPAAMRHGSRVVRGGWLLGIALLLAELAVSVHVAYELTWNPRVERREVVGVWEGGEITLELMEDGRYRAPLNSGQWRLAGHSLELVPAPVGFENPTFLRYGKTLRLLPNLADPDEWAGELGLRKKP